MPGASFVQTSFLGGAWSPPAQTRTDLPGYKTALKVCTNAYPRINGAWTRRPGFQFMAHTRQGQQGRLIGLEFSYQTPFQLELTNATMRAYLGQALVLTGDNNVTVSAISTATPAVVTVNGALPSTWANGDTIVFNFAQPMSTPVLSGRQFTISAITATTFALNDALTGAAVNGTGLAYAATTFGLDYIYKVQEWTTPYTADELNDVRLVKNGTTGLLLHAKHQPQSLTYGSSGIVMAAQSFSDGPYLDINATTTTLTPSAASGSITLTASSTAGINNNYGFASSDIGRLVRFQSAPAAYASGTTYAKDALVLGSDNNIYQSVAGANIGHDPTTDDATHWVLTGQAVTWTWLTITAWTSTTVVTATVNGDALPSLAASTSWQLGLWSDTTGWPTCGTWFQGRFWLGSKTVPNRLDASVSNDDFNFAPTAPDGTVGDANAIAAPYNAPDSSQLYWMLPVQAGGVTLGTNSGEWLVRASALGDPITPTSIQIQRVSTYGCANIDPVNAQLTSVFVQRERRKVLDYANYPFGEATGWYAADLTLYSDDKSAGGIEELRYQEEPNKLLWARRTDGTLIGSTFQHAPYGRESYNGWHDHPVGGNRTVVSISTGPSFDGLSTTLFAVLKNATTGYYECVALTQPFEDDTAAWAANFTDGTASPSASYIMQTTNGDPFDGIRIYGLYDIAGQTVTPQIAGYDLGDFTVNGSGYVDVPFTTTFTKAVVESYNNGTDYGLFALPMAEALPVSFQNAGLGAYVGETTNLSGNGIYQTFLDESQNIVVMNQANGLRVYNAITTDQIRDATVAQIGGLASGYTGFYLTSGNISNSVYHPGTGCVYAHVGSSNYSPIWKIDITTLRLVQSYGKDNALGGAGYYPTSMAMIALSMGGLNFIVQASHGNGGPTWPVTMFNADVLDYVSQYSGSDTHIFMCEGASNAGVFFGLGTPAYESGYKSTAVSIYKFAVQAAPFFGIGAVDFTTAVIGTLTPASVDSTWTNMTGFAGFAFDPTDDNLLAVAQNTYDAVTNKYYWLKINSATGAVIWATAITSTQYPGAAIQWPQTRPKNGIICYSFGSTWYSLNTATGVLTTTAITTGGYINGGVQLYWPEQHAIVLKTQAFWNPADVTPLGAYAVSNNGAGWTTEWSLLTLKAPTLSADWPPPSNYNFSLPATIGVTYTSKGQLLKPDFGYESGARNGPGFGKIRRHHWYGATMVRSQTFQIGTDPAGTLYDVPMLDYTTNQVSSPSPALYSGTVSQTLQDGYSFDNSIYWQVSRPTPLTISAMGGFLETQDK